MRVRIGKDGSATVTTENFVGQACMKETEELLVKLGRVKSDEKTPEYYQPEPPTDAWINQK